jgi:hypothetical protein
MDSASDRQAPASHGGVSKPTRGAASRVRAATCALLSARLDLGPQRQAASEQTAEAYGRDGLIQF